jgi:hypothetical protein
LPFVAWLPSVLGEAFLSDCKDMGVLSLSY